MKFLNWLKSLFKKKPAAVPSKPVAEVPKSEPSSPSIPVQKSLWYPKAVIPKNMMKTKGKYKDGYPKGALVHFTVGHDKSEKDALVSYDWGRQQGYVFFMIGPTGVVYQGFPLNEWGNHAGVSRWSGLGLTGVSSKLVGIEIANAGKLTKNKSSFGVTYGDSEIRTVNESYGCPAGQYKKYTEAQEKALIELLVWLKKNNPEIFDTKYILGHHEVSGKKGIGYWRKSDPGGALSMTMDQLRAKVSSFCS